MKKILVIGSKGMLGHVVLTYFKEQNCFEVKNIARDDSFFVPDFSIDLCELEKLDNVIYEFRPDYIVNCVGILNDYAENNPEKAIFINSYLPHYIASKFKNISKLIHISTDCVFSGKNGEYQINDFKDGQDIYATTKSLGEVVYGNNLTIRTSIIGPELKSNGIGLLHWALFNSDNKIKGFKLAYWSGLTTLQLAKSLHKILQSKDDFSGLIHLTNNKKINKYDLLGLIKNIFKLSFQIEPCFKYKVDKSLINENNSKTLKIPNYNLMLKDLKIWMNNHNHLYNF
tara:strand:- start:99 stop:953 length:855 start_codon:yes stop_codon:yes gene_type:complete